MTEAVSDRYAELDNWSAADAIEAMHEGQMAALAAIRPALEDIASAVEAAAERLGEKGRLVYVGAGTSGRLAVQDGAELTPTFNWPTERTVFCMAGGLDALVTSVEGAEDSVDNAAQEMHQHNVGANDVVIAVAASGRTPSTLSALREAKRCGALTIGIAMNAATPIIKDADHAILAETGSELVAGSTRMKAGTAQKVILNMISTGIMVQLGRVYGGYMVDMVVSNNKLAERAVRIVSDIANCSANVARKALTTADNNIKQAVLISMGHSQAVAAEMLAEKSGNLRQVLTSLNATDRRPDNG
ncbi:MAG: N-acetylmuramic acid 6-phosphate etherase [Kordiimonadaceae bacterium]|nr:N-acetylmuramic acid 6-phosphate etherase [Kordiimonadaceae bacterium]MBO6569769.1 N-acetylmuramic acid 6-phosphate etherase [Kordiimonadaceae bacterium]MBO6966304.1 N-acetylmuramic acid 6-phosphate etherase [Kordiimonadaceae bacterium]